MISKLSTGTYPKAMQKCIAEKYEPSTVSKVMQLRVDGEYCDTYVDTCDAVVYGRKGKFKVWRNCPLLKSITLNKLKDGYLPITPVAYRKIKGKEFDITKLKIDKYLTRTEALNNPIWNALCPDKKLLKQYVDMVFDKISGENMGIYLSDDDEYAVRPVILCRLGYGADAYDGGRLGSTLARLVGVKNSTSGANVISHPEICGNCKQCGQIWKSLMKHVKEEH